MADNQATELMASGPAEAAIRKALGRLCTRGVEPYWVQEEGGVLLDLFCVRARCADGDQAVSARAEALVDLLRELVGERMRDTQAGRLLWIALALDPEYLGTPAKERQRIAGEKFRLGARPVTWGSIRSQHQPKALDRLSVLLVAEERRATPATA